MIEHMLSSIIQDTFEKYVGKGQGTIGKALHVGFRINTGETTDQYKICHMYIFAPMNYVHVAVQEEIIDANGARHVRPMKHLCYHDSCWRDAIQSFIFENRNDLNGFQSLQKLLDWYDVVVLSKEEKEYLHLMDAKKTILSFNKADNKKAEEKLKNNPFDKRSVWH